MNTQLSEYNKVKVVISKPCYIRIPSYAVHDRIKGQRRDNGGMNSLLSDSVPPTRPQSTRGTGNVDCCRRSCPPLVFRGDQEKNNNTRYQLANQVCIKRGITVPPSLSHPSLSPVPAPMPPVPVGTHPYRLPLIAAAQGVCVTRSSPFAAP